MKISLSLRLLLLMSGLMFAMSVAVLPAYADHHEEDGAEMHDEHEEDSHADEEHDSRLETMQTLLSLLQQLATLLQAQLDGQEVHVHDDSHEHEEDAHEHDDHETSERSDTLKVWVEVHDGSTHVHVDNPYAEFTTFFLDDVAYTDEDGVIAATAERTGLTEEDISAVIVFPDAENLDYAGIHIMADGKVMLGDGTHVEHATINDDGMIVLEDGTVLEPAFDLR